MKFRERDLGSGVNVQVMGWLKGTGYLSVAALGCYLITGAILAQERTAPDRAGPERQPIREALRKARSEAERPRPTTPSVPAPNLGKVNGGEERSSAGDHPLDPAIKMAYSMRDHIREDLRDYRAVLIKRERVKGELTEPQFIEVKVRNRFVQGKKMVTPFSIYLKFLKPRNVEGREVLWVEGWNSDKMMAHEGGLKNLFSVSLDPKGGMAMNGQRYPIYEIGIQNLNDKLIERGERDRKHEECEVKFFRNAKIDDRVCTMIQVKHPQPRNYFDFHMAQVFVDDEWNLPIRYASYQWPRRAGEEPPLDEEYTYKNLQINVGLTDRDFSPDNPEYKFR